MKKLFILSMCLILCGCSVKAPQPPNHLETQDYTTEQQTTSVQNITVYLYNETTERLESKIVPVTIYPDQTRAEAALVYLLSTPNFNFALNSYGVPDYSLTISSGIAKVSITNAYNGDDKQKSLALQFSVVNTLCAIEGINFVGVYAGNSELCQDAYIGPSRFLEKNIPDFNMEIYGTLNAKGSTQNSVLLYYADKSYEFAVPEHHSIYSNIADMKDTVSAIITQMARQPVDSADLTPPVSRSVHVNAVSIKGAGMTIDLDANPWIDTMNNKDLTMACIYYTITGVYPNIASIDFTIGGKSMDYPTVNKDTFTDSIGSAITLYMTKQPMDSLYPVSRFISANSSNSVSQIVESLIDGPVGYDGTDLISPVFGHLAINNLISAKVVNDLAIVNFDIEFYNTVKSLSRNQESIMIYSIVNSITEREQVNRVQFLINGQSFNTINGNINYSHPLISNPGLVLK